jgi:hypothetical protein
MPTFPLYRRLSAMNRDAFIRAFIVAFVISFVAFFCVSFVSHV